ncbi:22762_t:CDS:2, partial [Dentiscutata erythropus]
KRLKNEAFHDAAITASTIWKNYLHTEQECNKLIFHCLDAELTEYELREIVNLASINNFIDEKAEKSKSENDNTYDNNLSDDLSNWGNLILEETVNLKDPIFQEKDFILCEVSTNTSRVNKRKTPDVEIEPEELIEDGFIIKDINFDETTSIHKSRNQVILDLALDKPSESIEKSLESSDSKLDKIEEFIRSDEDIEHDSTNESGYFHYQNKEAQIFLIHEGKAKISAYLIMGNIDFIFYAALEVSFYKKYEQ